MADDTTTPAPAPEALPQAGGSYTRQPDGTLVLIKPKAELADLVAAKQASTKPIQE